MAEKPTIVVVQGAFYPPELYKKFEDSLQAVGFDVVHPVLPTCSNTDADDYGERGPADDAMVIRSCVKRLVEQSFKTVVIAMHSYGGIPVTNIDWQDLSIASRLFQGLSGGLAQLIFFGSVPVPEGYSNHNANRGNLPVDLELKDGGRFVYKSAAEKHFNELSETDRNYWISKSIPHSLKVLAYETSHAAYRYIPTACIVLDRDRSIPAQVQEMLATGAGARVEHLDAGYAAVLTDPDLLAQKMHEIVFGTTD